MSNRNNSIHGTPDGAVETGTGLFSPYTLKGVTLRNRIVMSPMTMYHSIDGKMNDYHLMYLGARAAGGFGLIFPEQIAVSPDGRSSVNCGGLYDDAQIESHARVVSMIKQMGSVAGVQLGHTGRKGSELAPWDGGAQIAPDHAEGWQVVGPSDIPQHGTRDRRYPVHSLTVEEIKRLHQNYKQAALRALDAGYEWLELHAAHGYLISSFFSPLANQRKDQYGGSLENRARFLLETIDAVREVWPAQLPLTVRMGADDFHPEGTQFEESVVAIGWMKEHGLDMADLSHAGNTDTMTAPFFGNVNAWVERASYVKNELGLPMAVSWNLGLPADADAAIRSGSIDLVMLGRPALANPHWPVWAARELGLENHFDLVPHDWGWWLKNFRGHAPSIGWPRIQGEDDSPAVLPKPMSGAQAN